MSATNSLDDERKRFHPYTYELLLNEETRLHQTGKSKGSSPVLHEETAGTRRRISKNGRRYLAGSLLGSGGRRRLRCHPAEGVEIGPDMLHGLLVKSLDRSISAL